MAHAPLPPPLLPVPPAPLDDGRGEARWWLLVAVLLLLLTFLSRVL